MFKISALCCASMLSVMLYFNIADGNTDDFYLKFTSPRQYSLIIGSSRAAQGILPDIIQNEFEKKKRNISIYNYSFSLNFSSYGPGYYNSIKKKINSEKSERIFILEVNPWTISDKSETPDDSTMYVENSLPVGTLDYVNLDPNFIYLWNYFGSSYINIVLSKFKKERFNKTFLHRNGWLEVTVKMDSLSVKERQIRTINEFGNNAIKTYHFSTLRFEYLQKTIEYLSEWGNVYLVRMPVHEELLEIENKYMIDFDLKMNVLSDQFNAKFINLKDSFNSVSFTDGNHLYKDSGKKISKDIADMILQYEL